MNKAERINVVERMVTSLSATAEPYHIRAALLEIINLIRDLERWDK